MINRVAAALMVGAVAIAATGTGVAIGSSTSAGVKACSTNSTHKLGLIKNGKCAKGSKKVTLGAQGPRGKTGPQGPGAIEVETTIPNEDIQHTLSTNVAGISVTANCTAAANPSIDIAAVNSGQMIDFFGTKTVNGTLATATENQTSNNFPLSGSTNVGLDVIARAGSAPFMDLRIYAFQSGTHCVAWEVAVPSKSTG